MLRCCATKLDQFGALPEPVSLSGVSFIHAVLDERPAALSREILSVGEVLAGIHLVLLTHFVNVLITGFAEAVLHEVLAIISLEAFIVGQVVTGFHFVLLRRSLLICCSAGGKP